MISLAPPTAETLPFDSQSSPFLASATPTKVRGLAASVEKLDGGATMLAPEKARLMIIDDESINVRIIEKALRQAGYRQIIAHIDSESALETIVAQRPDVVLCDVCMPVSGMDILRAQS